MAKRKYRNRLNNLSTKEWLKFQKSWFIHNPPPRKKGVLVHPAKYPETLVREFIEFFTKEKQVVLDPMVGTGSTVVAALRSKRHSIGIELNPGYAEIARKVIDQEYENLGDAAIGLKTKVITGDAGQIQELFSDISTPEIDYVITSPPYWDMLHARGAATQKKRREDSDLDVFYSDHPNDLGNIHDYESFLDSLVNIYAGLKPFLRRALI